MSGVKEFKFTCSICGSEFRVTGPTRADAEEKIRGGYFGWSAVYDPWPTVTSYECGGCTDRQLEGVNWQPLAYGRAKAVRR